DHPLADAERLGEGPELVPERAVAHEQEPRIGPAVGDQPRRPQERRVILLRPQAGEHADRPRPGRPPQPAGARPRPAPRPAGGGPGGGGSGPARPGAGAAPRGGPRRGTGSAPATRPRSSP